MFYTINQNNSGGYYIVNEEVAEFVSVEANSPEEAEDKLNRIVEDYSEFCECCGERWYVDMYGKKGTEKPMIYDMPYDNCTDTFWNRGDIVIYYLDGRVEKVSLRVEGQ